MWCSSNDECYLKYSLFEKSMHQKMCADDIEEDNSKTFTKAVILPKFDAVHFHDKVVQLFSTLIFS